MSRTNASDHRESSNYRSGDKYRHTILVTPDDLSNNRTASPATGSRTLYVKPLPSSTSKTVKSGRNSGKRAEPQEGDESPLNGVPLHSYAPDTLPSGHNSRKSSSSTHEPSIIRESGFCTVRRRQQGAFERNSATRRSLGGTALPLPMDSSVSIDDHHFPSNIIGNGSLLSPTLGTYDSGPVQTIRVVNLPSLDELGFSLDSYSDPETAEFTGLRLFNRFRTRPVQSNLKHCPFRSGDLIVSVNQHRLSRMHESQAIRYVYNAFKDARQYAVEFGIIRSESMSNDDKPVRVVPYQSATDPGRSKYRYNTVSLRPTLDADIFNAHQPRRSIRRANLTGLDNSPENQNSPIPDRSSSSTLMNDSGGDVQFTVPSTSKPEAKKSSALLDSTRRKDESCNSEPAKDCFSPNATSQRMGNVPSIPKDVNAFNTRAIGYKIIVELVKQPETGLGFTLTSRDTDTSFPGENPVCIKKILSNGPAIADGRLLVGDRLLSVDDIEVQNMSQVLDQIRAIDSFKTVQLVVSRQCEEHSAHSSDAPVLPKRPSRSLTFEFSLPADSSTKPSLGVNLRWATEPPPFNDSKLDSVSEIKYAPTPGLYIEELLPGGLLSSNPHHVLLPGDRLAGMNGQSFEGFSAKEISTFIKKVLADCARKDRTGEGTASDSDDLQHSRTFSLTVHRYSYGRISRSQSGLNPDVIKRRLSAPGATLAIDITDKRSGHHPTPLEEQEPSKDQGPSHLRITGNTSPTQAQSVPSSGPFFHSDLRFTFSREDIGRRSVSEKRHGHIDPNQFPFFVEHVLPNRYKMPEEVDKQYSTMPTTRRLKIYKQRMSTVAPPAKSPTTSSVASGTGPIKALPLNEIPHTSDTTEVSENRSETDLPDETTSSRVHRGRKQNNSFRHAVDRSLNSEPTEDCASSATNDLTDHDSLLFPSKSSSSRPILQPAQHRISRIDYLSSNPPSRRTSREREESTFRQNTSTAHSGTSTTVLPSSDVSDNAPPLPARKGYSTSSLSKTKSNVGFGTILDFFRRSSSKQRFTEESLRDTHSSTIERVSKEVETNRMTQHQQESTRNGYYRSRAPLTELDKHAQLRVATVHSHSDPSSSQPDRKRKPHRDTHQTYSRPSHHDMTLSLARVNEWQARLPVYPHEASSPPPPPVPPRAKGVHDLTMVDSKQLRYHRAANSVYTDPGNVLPKRPKHSRQPVVHSTERSSVVNGNSRPQSSKYKPSPPNQSLSSTHRAPVQKRDPPRSSYMSTSLPNSHHKITAVHAQRQPLHVSGQKPNRSSNPNNRRIYENSQLDATPINARTNGGRSNETVRPLPTVPGSTKSAESFKNNANSSKNSNAPVFSPSGSRMVLGSSNHPAHKSSNAIVESSVERRRSKPVQPNETVRPRSSGKSHRTSAYQSGVRAKPSQLIKPNPY